MCSLNYYLYLFVLVKPPYLFDGLMPLVQRQFLLVISPCFRFLVLPQEMMSFGLLSTKFTGPTPFPGQKKNKIYSKNMVSCTFINPLISVVTITRPKVCLINPNGYVCVGVSHTSQIATLYNRDDSVMIHQWI